MNEVRELLKVARYLAAGPSPMSVLRQVQHTMNRLDELSDNIEDEVNTFGLHFRVAADVDTDVDSQFDLLKKAIEGLKAAQGAQKQLGAVSKQYPEDKTVQRALKDADTMIRRFERHEVQARKVIKALSKKDMPPGLKKYAQSVARIVKAKFVDPKKLEVIPWQQKHYKGGVMYQVVLVVRDEGLEERILGGKMELTLAEHTSSREPAGVESGYSIKQMSPKEAAGSLLDRLRGWEGLKGAVAEGAKRQQVATGVASAMKRAINSMRAWMQEDPEIRRDFTIIEGSYRSHLPKEGASDVGHYAYEAMVEEEINNFKKQFEPLIRQYAKDIRNIRYYDSEKSWIHVEVELK